MKYAYINETFKFLFPRSDNETKRGVKFRRSTLNVFRIRRKLGKGSVLMGTECFNARFPGSICLHCYVRDTACLNLYFNKKQSIKTCKHVIYPLHRPGVTQK